MIRIRISSSNRMSIIWEYLYRMLHKINKKDLWKTLLEENKHDLINKLRKVEKREEGYGSIVIPKNGFSENLSTHFAVVSWLKDKGINIIDTNKIIDDLEKSLKG